MTVTLADARKCWIDLDGDLWMLTNDDVLYHRFYSRRRDWAPAQTIKGDRDWIMAEIKHLQLQPIQPELAAMMILAEGD